MEFQWNFLESIIIYNLMSVNYVTQTKGSTSRKAHVDYDGKTFLSIMQLILIVDLLDIGSYLTLVIY
jgi:hypothetical protein